MPLIFSASFHTTDCMPSFGFQWNLTKVDLPSALTSRKVWTPNPSIKRNERGIVRSDMIHSAMCMLSGVSEMKSQKLSCARLRLRKAAVGLLLGGMDDVGELDRVLDEEHRDVVADEVPVAFLGVELDREAAHVARQIGRSLAAGHGREAHEDRRLFAGALEQIGAGDVGQRFVILEIAVRAIAARMHDALGNALVVEVEDLLAEMEILERGRPAPADPQRVLVVGDRGALLRRQDRDIAARDLMRLAAFAAHDRGVAELGRFSAASRRMVPSMHSSPFRSPCHIRRIALRTEERTPAGINRCERPRSTFHPRRAYR